MPITLATTPHAEAVTAMMVEVELCRVLEDERGSEFVDTDTESAECMDFFLSIFSAEIRERKLSGELAEICACLISLSSSSPVNKTSLLLIHTHTQQFWGEYSTSMVLTRTSWATSVFRIDWILTFRDTTLSRQIENLSLVAVASHAGISLVRYPALSIFVDVIVAVPAFIAGWCRIDEHQCWSNSLRWTCGTAVAGKLNGIGTGQRKTRHSGAEWYSSLASAGDTCIALPGPPFIVLYSILHASCWVAD